MRLVITAASPEETRIHLDFLDGWRGLAILTVLVAHFWSDQWRPVGALGVELFFVLSGRLMATILFVNEAPLGRFLFRRFARIYPVLLVYSIVVFFLFRGSWFSGDLLSLLASIDLINNYVQDWHPTGIYVHIWSLSVEEHSYLLLAMIALLVRHFRLRPLVPIALLTALAMANGFYRGEILRENYFAVYWHTDVRFSSIGMGAVAYLVVPALRLEKWSKPLISGAFLVLLGAGLYLGSDHNLHGLEFTVGTACLAFAIACIDYVPLARTIFSFKPLVYIGILSYSLYIWQQPFTFFEHMPRIFNFAGVFAISLTSFYFLERPMRRFLVASFEKRH